MTPASSSSKYFSFSLRQTSSRQLELDPPIDSEISSKKNLLYPLVGPPCPSSTEPCGSSPSLSLLWSQMGPNLSPCPSRPVQTVTPLLLLSWVCIERLVIHPSRSPMAPSGGTSTLSAFSWVPLSFLQESLFPTRLLLVPSSFLFLARVSSQPGLKLLISLALTLAKLEDVQLPGRARPKPARPCLATSPPVSFQILILLWRLTNLLSTKSIGSHGNAPTASEDKAPPHIDEGFLFDDWNLGTRPGRRLHWRLLGSNSNPPLSGSKATWRIKKGAQTSATKPKSPPDRRTSIICPLAGPKSLHPGPPNWSSTLSSSATPVTSIAIASKTGQVTTSSFLTAPRCCDG